VERFLTFVLFLAVQKIALCKQAC